MDFIGKICQDFHVTCVSSCCNGSTASERSVSVGVQTEQFGWDRQIPEGSRKKDSGIKREEVREFLETQYAYTRHKPARRKFPKRAVIAVNINDVYQMDLVDLQKFAEFNDGVKYLLTAFDCFTRYAFAVPIKSEKPAEIIQARAQPVQN